MFEEIWDEILCEIAMGNFYFAQLAENMENRNNIEDILNEMEKFGLIYFIEARVCLTESGSKRIQGKLNLL